MRDGEVSMTARRVAVHRLSFDRVPSPFGRPDDDQRLQADVAAGLEVGQSIMTRYLQARTTFFDTVIVRGLGLEVDDQPTAGDAPAITQAVAVGAGYDGRSLRYARPGIRWFELDHPETQADKRARLDRLAIDTTGVTFVPADFTIDDVSAELERAGHDAGRPSIFICEGVAGYLSIDTVLSLLGSLGRAAAPGSRLAMTLPLTPVSTDGQVRRERLDAAVTDMGEPLASTIPREEVAARLAAAGWTVLHAMDPAGVAIEQSSRNGAFVVAGPD